MMKTFFTFLLSSLLLLISTISNAQDGIKVGPTGKSSLELRFNARKATIATITITNEANIVVSTQTSDVVKGENKILIADATKLNEGTFTVTMVSNGKTETTKFVNFKMDEKGL
jgi:hypothetical protein